MNLAMQRKKTQEFAPTTPTKKYKESLGASPFRRDFVDNGNNTSMRPIVRSSIQPHSSAQIWGSRVQEYPLQSPQPFQPRTSSINIGAQEEPHNKSAINQTLHANLRSLRKSQVDPLSMNESEQTPQRYISQTQKKYLSNNAENSLPPVTSFLEPSQPKQNKPIRESVRPRTPVKTRQSGKFGFQFSFRSKKGYMPNVNKENQDICIVNANINNKPWEHFFAVCDGHGQHGHQISALIKTHLTSLIGAKPDFHQRPQENIYKAFQNTFQALIKETQIDTHTSGSTVVSVYIHENKLYCGNAGDSRAVLCSKEPRSGRWVAKPLSNDHKPTHPQEAQRILMFNGRLESLKDQYGQPVGPLRVWLSNQQAPGLAMTRSMGDLMASSVGVTWQPEITEHTITPNDHILVIASDGIWEFLSNEQVAFLLAPYYQRRDIQQASKVLMEKAAVAWYQNAQMIDDISFVLVFFEHSSS